jgi:hypothetical protein
MSIMKRMAKQGRQKQCEAAGQPFQKGTCFSIIIFLGGNIC